jgi:hypothetical protein
MKLYGDGRENWLGLECYDPDQNETTGWVMNLWVKGTARTDYIEFTISDSRYDHVVIWYNANPGLQGTGSGVLPRLPDHRVIQAGSGIASITSGYIFLSR